MVGFHQGLFCGLEVSCDSTKATSPTFGGAKLAPLLASRHACLSNRLYLWQPSERRLTASLQPGLIRPLLYRAIQAVVPGMH